MNERDLAHLRRRDARHQRWRRQRARFRRNWRHLRGPMLVAGWMLAVATAVFCAGWMLP